MKTYTSKPSTSSSPADRGLIHARRIQAKLNGRIIDAAPVGNGWFWNPIVAAPHFSRVSRWVE